MNILMYRWKAYNQHDLIKNLEKRGHSVYEITGELETFEEDYLFEKRLRKRFDENTIDLMLTINYFPLISDVCQEYGIKYLSWCCDSPISTMYNESVFNPVNIILTFDRLDQMTFEEMGANVEYLPLCADTDRIDEMLEQAEEKSLHKAEITFIGSMYNKNSYDQVYPHMTEYMKGYFDCAMKMQMNTYERYMLDDILDGDMLVQLEQKFSLKKSTRSFSDLSLIFSTTILSYKIAQLERKNILSALSARHAVDVYTDDDKVSFLKGTNHGTADYWREAPVIFHNSKINLNLTLRSIRSGIPLRVWDIMAAGGFCITNYQPELPLFFENGRDLVWFKTREELFEKIDYYLTHEEERVQIALSGRNKIKKYHTYAHRLDSISEIIPGL